MKKWIISFVALAFILSSLFADTYAITDEGKKVLLKEDGTWEYVQEAVSDEDESPSDVRKLSDTTYISSNWTAVLSKDTMTDARKIRLYSHAIEGRNSWRDNISFVMRWNGGKTDVYANWREYLGMDDIRVTYRIGTSPAQTATWSISTDNKACFFRGNEEELIRQLIQEEQFAIRLTPYGENTKTAVFSLLGLRELIISFPELVSWLPDE